MGSQLKEQTCAYATVFNGAPSFDWPMLCYSRFSLLPIAEILARKNCPLPNGTSENITCDEVYELDFIRHETRMAAYCLHKGIPYIDDTLGLTVHAALETNPELIEYCTEFGISLYTIKSELIIAVTNKNELNELNDALNNSVDNLTASPLKETLESLTTSFYLIGASVEHTKTNLANIHTQNADPSLVLEDIFAPLLPIFEYTKSVNASFIRFELDPKNNQIRSIQAFEHERAYCETSINPKQSPKLAFALKQLDNRFKAVSSSNDTCHFLNIFIPNKTDVTHCRTKSNIRNDGVKIIFLEVIKSQSDVIVSPVKTPISGEMNNIREEVEKAISENRSLILSVPKNRCMRFISDILLAHFIKIFQQGQHCLVINHSYFRYTGNRLINLDEKEITDEEFMQNQFASAVLYGAINTQEHLKNISQAINNLQTIVGVTHASINQLPSHLQEHAITIV
ncbi:hypothetical protein [Vibrio sp. R78045]|uniref:hypothetical protein n=1 Tax=Vibrio sp. R78045 TaxID=3093868 RepID=UPI0036F3562A